MSNLFQVQVRMKMILMFHQGKGITKSNLYSIILYNTLGTIAEATTTKKKKVNKATATRFQQITGSFEAG